MKLSEFEMSRFSSRTVWVAVAVVAVVLGLFFIPEIINLQKSITGSKTEKIAQRTAVEDQDEQAVEQAQEEIEQEPTETEAVEAEVETVPVADEEQAAESEDDQGERASVSNSALHDISAEIDEQPALQKAPEPVKREKIADVPAAPKKSNGNILSGFKLRDGGNATAVLSGLDHLTGKDVQNFFRKGRSDLGRFAETAPVKEPRLREIYDAFLQAFDVIASGGISTAAEEESMRNHLVSLYNGIVARMQATAFDRGLMIQWKDIPSVNLISKLEGAAHYKSYQIPFVPGIALRNLTVRAQRKGPPKVTAEIAIRGSDVEKVEIYQRGVAIRAPGLSGADRDGNRSVRLSGDADGLWTLVLHDKFGGAPYQKSYAFYPRIRKFAKNPDGTYRISFRQPTPPNALDRFFTVSYTRRSRSSTPRDPAIGTF